MATTAVPSSHIHIDERGRALIAGTRTKVTMVVRDLRAGMTAEQIREAYPYLSLAQIYAAFSYYYDHQAELDAEIERQDQMVAQLRAEAEASGSTVSRAELERRMRERGGEQR